MSAPASVRSVLAEATAALGAAGSPSADADARWLLAHTLGVDRGRLLLVDDLDDDTARRYRHLIDERARGVPLQHLTGSAGFGPIDLCVGPGVFVPRPETELLYDWAIGAIGDSTESVTVVDLCSGSGALAIAVATTLPRARVHAVELSADAGQWLRRNVAAAGAQVAHRLHVHLGDATDATFVAAALGGGAMAGGAMAGGADLVLSNPPYVPAGADVPVEVRADPAMAVFGGADGLSVITPMVGVIGSVLRPGGLVGIEHDDGHRDGVLEVFEAAGVFEEIVSHDDLAGRPRFVTARRAS